MSRRSVNPDVARARARRSVLSKLHGPDSPEALDAKRELNACNLEQQVAAVVNAFPPLTQDQLDRIAVLLRPAGGGAA